MDKVICTQKMDSLRHTYTIRPLIVAKSMLWMGAKNPLFWQLQNNHRQLHVLQLHGMDHIVIYRQTMLLASNLAPLRPNECVFAHQPAHCLQSRKDFRPQNQRYTYSILCVLFCHLTQDKAKEEIILSKTKRDCQKIEVDAMV